jgi:hypothetical protein
MQALHLKLCGMQLAEPLLRGVQQAVSLSEPIEPVSDGCSWAVPRDIKDSVLVEKEANQPAHPGSRTGRLPYQDAIDAGLNGLLHAVGSMQKYLNIWPRGPVVGKLS